MGPKRLYPGGSYTSPRTACEAGTPAGRGRWDPIDGISRGGTYTSLPGRVRRWTPRVW